MTRLEILELLRELFDGAHRVVSDPDDWSGANTKYLVDQEEVLVRLDRLIRQASQE
jgi:hypothetical protein